MDAKPELSHFRNMLGLDLGVNGYRLLEDVTVIFILRLDEDLGIKVSNPIVITNGIFAAIWSF
jgi:hypothetical protein